MEAQNDLFDGAMGQRLKERGMARAEESAEDYLTLAREIAVEIARQKGEVTADDVGRILKRDHGIDSLGPATGSLFRTKQFQWTGNWRKSKRISNHARMIRVWELRP